MSHFDGTAYDFALIPGLLGGLCPDYNQMQQIDILRGYVYHTIKEDFSSAADIRSEERSREL